MRVLDTTTTIDDPIDVAPAPIEHPVQGWRSHRVLAGLLAAAVLLVPVCVAVAVALTAGRIVEHPDTTGPLVAWWVGVFLLSAVAAWLADRVARRFLPLVVLLRLALVFPGDVPSRLGVALRAGTVRDLERVTIDLREPQPPGLTETAAHVVALAAALHRHDRFTRGHCERVRAYTDLIAAELGVPPADRDKLHWAALLHDVGKLTVSAQLLNKPAGLDEAEWLVMRQHPAAGAELAEPLRPWLGHWVDAIGQHHERFDGSGYPNGLAGKDIALGARIVAVADSYETMTAARAYKKPMSPSAARRELVEKSGTHFDPDVVRAMLNLSTRRLRWAAGPLAALGDGVAAVVATKVAVATRPLVEGARLLPLASGVTAAAAVAAVGVPAAVDADPAPPAPAPVVITTTTTTAPPTTTTSTPPDAASGESAPADASPGVDAPPPALADGQTETDAPAAPATGAPADEEPTAVVEAPPTTEASPPQGANPATPATPAEPHPGEGPATPATPATPAEPAPPALENSNGNGPPSSPGEASPVR